MNSTWFINVRNEIKPLVFFDTWPALISFFCSWSLLISRRHANRMLYWIFNRRYEYFIALSRISRISIYIYKHWIVYNIYHHLLIGNYIRRKILSRNRNQHFSLLIANINKYIFIWTKNEKTYYKFGTCYRCNSMNGDFCSLSVETSSRYAVHYVGFQRII